MGDSAGVQILESTRDGFGAGSSLIALSWGSPRAESSLGAESRAVLSPVALYFTHTTASSIQGVSLHWHFSHILETSVACGFHRVLSLGKDCR